VRHLAKLMTGLALVVGLSASVLAKDITLLNVSYDPTEVVLAKLRPAAVKPILADGVGG
jgi:ABC-type sulfate transport system, periplasmic component